MHAFPFNSLRSTLAAAILGAASCLTAQTPPIDVNTAIRVDFTGSMTNAEYFGEAVTGTFFIYSPSWNPTKSGYDNVPELSSYWKSFSATPVGLVTANIKMGNVFDAAFYTTEASLTMSDTNYVSPYVGHTHTDQFDIATGGNTLATNIVVFNGTAYDLPYAYLSLAAALPDSVHSIFNDPTEFSGIVPGLNSITATDLTLNGFQNAGRFNFMGGDDFTFNLTSISATTVAIPEPQTYALALGAASMIVVGARRMRRRQSGRE